MKAVKKPIVVEFRQWTGNNLKEILDFTGQHKSIHGLTFSRIKNLVEAQGLKIFTLEGVMSAKITDIIIKGINGEFYPCDVNIFNKTYDIIEGDLHEKTP